jgi:hypothetical protein
MPAEPLLRAVPEHSARFRKRGDVEHSAFNGERSYRRKG